VGAADCCEPVPVSDLPEGTVSFDGCTGVAETCLNGRLAATAFGFPEPRMRDGGLYPAGEADHDSGLLVGEPVDLGAYRVDVGAVFAEPADCGASCLEGVSVGFSTQTGFSDRTHVRPLVALSYSGSRDEVSLVVGDTRVQSWQHDGDMQRWRLLLRPTGWLEVFAEGTEEALARRQVSPASAAQLVVYGRNRNPGSATPEGARLEELSVTTALCDIPWGWSERNRISFRLGGGLGDWEPSSVRAPSLAYDSEGRAAVAFEHDGSIFFARRASIRPEDDELVLQHGVDVPALEPRTDGEVRDPELLAREDGGWLLFYTEEDDAGRRAIGLAKLDPGAMTPTFERDGEDPLLKPSDFGFDALEAPTVVRHFTGELVAVVRATIGETHTLEVFRRGAADGASWWHMEASGLPDAVRAAAGAGGFDSDEIGEPALVVHDGAWQLYYAGRRGTRWNVGLLASDALVSWRRIDAGMGVLSRRGSHYERVGVSEPSVVSLGNGAEVVYAGTDGTRWQLGRAYRAATDMGTRIRP